MLLYDDQPGVCGVDERRNFSCATQGPRKVVARQRMDFFRRQRGLKNFGDDLDGKAAQRGDLANEQVDRGRRRAGERHTARQNMENRPLFLCNFDQSQSVALRFSAKAKSPLANSPKSPAALAEVSDWTLELANIIAQI